MPVYEYACTACGERTEAKQGFDDPPLEECPVCGGRLRKLYSPVGIVFKGSGFYATDARKKSSTTGPKKPAEAKSESSSGGEASKADSGGGKSSEKKAGGAAS